MPTSTNAINPIPTSQTLTCTQVAHTQSLLKQSDSALQASLATALQQQQKASSSLATLQHSHQCEVVRLSEVHAALDKSHQSEILRQHEDQTTSQVAHQCQIAHLEEASAALKSSHESQTQSLSEASAVHQQSLQCEILRLSEASAALQNSHQCEIIRLGDVSAVLQHSNEREIVRLNEAFAALQHSHQSEVLQMNEEAQQLRAQNLSCTASTLSEAPATGGQEGVMLLQRGSELELENLGLCEQMRQLRMDLELAAAGVRRRDAHLLQQGAALAASLAEVQQLQHIRAKLEALQEVSSVSQLVQHSL